MSHDESGPVSGFAPLRVRDFRLLFFGFGIGQALMPLQFMTQIFFVQEHAPDNIWLLLVGLIGTMRGLGALTFGLYGGALADRFDRRKLLLVTQTILLATTAGLSVVMFVSDGGMVGFIVFFALTFVASGMFAVDAPTRLAMVPDLLGPRLTPAGISLNQAAGQISMPVAIFAAGFVIDGLGFGGAYALSGLGHIIEIAAIIPMAYRTRSEQTRDSRTSYGFRPDHQVTSREGLRYTRREPTVFWIIVIMVAMMGLGFPSNREPRAYVGDHRGGRADQVHGTHRRHLGTGGLPRRRVPHALLRLRTERARSSPSGPGCSPARSWCSWGSTPSRTRSSATLGSASVCPPRRFPRRP